MNVLPIFIFVQFGFLLAVASATLALYTVRYRAQKKQLYAHIVAVALSYVIMSGLLLLEMVASIPPSPQIKASFVILGCILGDYALFQILIFELKKFFPKEDKEGLM